MTDFLTGLQKLWQPWTWWDPSSLDELLQHYKRPLTFSHFGQKVMQQKKKTERVRKRRETGKEVRRDSLHLRLCLFINLFLFHFNPQTWQVETKKRRMRSLKQLKLSPVQVTQLSVSLVNWLMQCTVNASNEQIKYFLYYAQMQSKFYFFLSVLMFDISFSPVYMHCCTHGHFLMPLSLCVKKNKTRRGGSEWAAWGGMAWRWMTSLCGVCMFSPCVGSTPP